MAAAHMICALIFFVKSHILERGIGDVHMGEMAMPIRITA